jgi:BirA family biotin operon repressor/biotin-[acetyl-CoA-carboxylase] ligase
VTILRELEQDYARLRDGNFAHVADEWERHCNTIGQEIVIRAGERRLRGVAESLGDDGALLLRSEHGHLERVMGGDVTVDR